MVLGVGVAVVVVAGEQGMRHGGPLGSAVRRLPLLLLALRGCAHET